MAVASVTAGVSPAPLGKIGPDLAGVLVPYLAARTRGLASELRAVRAQGSDRDDPLSKESTTLGFVLGLMAAGCGIDVLHARREPGGLRLFVDLLARASGAPDSSCERLPDLTSAAPAVEAPLLVGWTWLAALRAGRNGEWTQHADSEAWWFSIPDALEGEALAGDQHAPWRWKREGARLALGLPRAWVCPRLG